MVPSVLRQPLQNHGHASFMMPPSYDTMSQQQLYYPESVRPMARSSSAQRAPNAMRVVKPTSASNSPSSSMNRRRTYMNDGHPGFDKRRQEALDQALLQQLQANAMVSGNTQPQARRQARPMSWHPHLQAYQMVHPINSVPVSHPPTDMYSGYFNFPPTPAAYSAHASPTANYSPLAQPYAAAPQAPAPQYSLDAYNGDATAYSNNGSPGGPEPFPVFTTQPFSWDAYASQQFQGSTSPPTPNDNQCAPQQEPNVSTDESLSFQPMEEPEEEGEILVGMGLYDTPDKTESDPGLDHYRTSTSQLLGSTYRLGQGLKLEEAWEPPATEDEAEDDEDDSSEKDEQEEAD